MPSAAVGSEGFGQRDGIQAQRSALDALRLAGERYLATGEDALLRDVARAIAADAAARGLRAEELVIAFKQLWTSVPELMPVRRMARNVVDELVTLCIIEFYRAPGAGRRHTPPA